MKVPLRAAYDVTDIAHAHRDMENSEGGGRNVVLVPGDRPVRE